MNELANCPFCGKSNPSVWQVVGRWRVKCVNGCLASTSGYISREGAIRAWNQRPQPKDDEDDPQVAYIAAIEADNERLRADNGRLLEACVSTLGALGKLRAAIAGAEGRDQT
jgi:hypothetical protein